MRSPQRHSYLSILGGLVVLVLLAPHFLSNPSLPVLNESDIVLPPAILPPTKPEQTTPTTLVTCFFDLNKMGQKTKHPPDFYLSTGKKGTLAIASPMIIFTDSPTEVARARSRPELTVIVNVSVSDFEVAKLHLNRLTQLITRDKEGLSFGYSGLLFTIYHLKPEMMKRAVELNPFFSKRFLYMDVGAIRDWGGVVAKDFIDQPFPRNGRDFLIGRNSRVMLQGVAGFNGPCTDRVQWVEAESPEKLVAPLLPPMDVLHVPTTPIHWWIAGSIFGGDGPSLLKYDHLYRMELKRYLDADFPSYSLIDQYLMGALACAHPDVVEVVRPPLKCCVDRVNRKWYFLLMFLSQDTYPQTPYTLQELSTRKIAPGSCKYC